MPKITMGIDQSLSSTGVVVVKDGKVLYKEIIIPQTNIIKFAKETNIDITNLRAYKLGLIDEVGKNIKKVKDRSKIERSMFTVPQPMRIFYIANKIASILDKYNIDRCGMEDIAFGGSGQIASLGMILGQVQRELMNRSIPFHVVNILSVKKFATGKGNAHKETMIAAIDDDVCKMLMEDIPEKSEDDIADAYHIANYVARMDEDELIRYS